MPYEPDRDMKQLYPIELERSPRHLWKAAFLAALGQCGNVRASCEAAGVHRTTVQRARKRDLEFARAYRQALLDAADLIMARATEGAVQGWEKPIIHQGVVTGTYREISEKMIMFLLRAHRPDMFGAPGQTLASEAQDLELQDVEPEYEGRLDLDKLSGDELKQLQAIVSRHLPERTQDA